MGNIENVIIADLYKIIRWFSFVDVRAINPYILGYEYNRNCYQN